MKIAYVPPARPEIVDAGLQRPDSTKPASRDPRLLWLDKNENTDPVLTDIVARVLAEMDPSNATTYPDCAPLYQTLAAYLGVDPKALILAPGSDGVIGSVFRAFIRPGDVVLHTKPTYAMYQVYSRMCGARTVELEYQRGVAGPYLSPETVAREIRERRPTLVCVPNPDSPSGTVFPPEVLRDLIETGLEAGSAFLVDEAYHPFYPQTVVPLIKDYPNLIVARTFSKAWGLSGVRLGYGIAAPETAALLQKVRPNYEVNMMGVALAVRMITDFEPEMRASVARLNEGREAFLSAMRGLGFATLTSHASFCHVRFGALSDKVHAALKDVVLYRRDSDAACLDGFSRFSATTIGLFEPVIARVRQVVQAEA